jgi:hypothetical protein
MEDFKKFIKERHELVSIVEDVDITGFFRKKAVIIGSNPFYNYIEIVNDYKTGKVLRETYTNITIMSNRPAFA